MPLLRNLQIKTTLSDVIHKNPWFSIEKHILSNKQVYFLLKKRPSVFIIAETDEKEIIFIKEYRYPLRKSILQLPAGMLDSGDSLSTAKRELLEETALKARKWQKIGSFYVAPGHETTKIMVYYAQNLYEAKRKPKKEKDIRKILKVPIKNVDAMIRGGKIECGISLAALSLLASRLR